MQILFLNKIDLFAEKLPRSPLGDYFPDYQGGDNYDAACSYLLNRFVSLNQSAATKQIYAHYTCATDTQQIKCELLLFYLVFVWALCFFRSCQYGWGVCAVLDRVAALKGGSEYDARQLGYPHMLILTLSLSLYASLSCCFCRFVGLVTD